MTRLAFLALAVATPVAAATFQDTAALDRAVAGFTGNAVGTMGGARTAVDARLKLAQCPTLALAWRTPAQDAVVVRCAGPEWRIFVPVMMPATQPVAAAARPAATIAVAPVIRRNDPVTIEAGTPGFSITREGVALGDAAPGARFLVRVEGGKGPVQATAVAAGRATLPGWGE
ncbi:MAG: flagella basal body P-ring formation protein FlgA [Pseudomonadota bacterium]